MSEGSTSLFTGFVKGIDRALGVIGFIFLHLATASLAFMALLTTATIMLRLFDISYYWMWPWTMIFFVWMVFFGFFAVYRFKKDIVIDIVLRRVKGLTSRLMPVFQSGVVLAVAVTLLIQLPTVFSAQRGAIEGALLPWGGEMSRLSLSVPLALSLLFIALQALLDLIFGQSSGSSAVAEATRTEGNQK